MANTIITPDLIGKEAVYQAVNQMVFGKLVDRHYEKDFTGGQGDTVNYPIPNRFKATSGAVISSIDDVNEKKIPFTIDQRWKTVMKYPMSAKTLSMTEFSKKYIRPAMLPLANKVDEILAGLALGFNMAVGTAGTTPATFKQFTAPKKMLFHMGVPDDGDISLALDPEAGHEAEAMLVGLQNTKAQEEALRRGNIGILSNMSTFRSQNIVYHTAGTLTGTPLVNGVAQEGSSISVDGFTGTVSVGTIFTIAGVYMVNPISKKTTGLLQQFTVTAARNGAGAMSISPAIVGPASVDNVRQNVDALPADNAAITFLGSARCNVAFHKNAIGLATVPLAMPESAGFKARYEYEGVSIRMIKAYDVTNDEETMRFDVLFGARVIYEDYGCRLLG